MSLLSRVPRPPPRLKSFLELRYWRTRASRPPPNELRHRGQAGQALPLFVLMIFVLTGSVAVVTDVSWFWVNQQKMQRAADAGALAGAVFLPGDPSGAYVAARAATKRNGYTDGVGGVVVTPIQELQNRRRMDVSVSGPIGTYFARVFGMNQVAGSAQSKAEFTLPVPMGSPQNYYGVGDVTKNNVTTNTTQTQANQRISAATVPSGSWTTPANAYGAGVASSTTTNGAVQQWGGFAFSNLPNDPTLVIEAITLRLDGADLNGSGTVTSCQLQTDLSWGAGVAGTWTSIQNSPDLSISPINVAVGSTTTLTSWGAHAWTYSNLSSTNFWVRLTWVNGPLSTSACPSTRYLDLDEVDAQVYWHTSTTTTTTTQTTGTVPNPAGGTPLASQGFWGAVITKGGSRENGDEFSPQNDNAGISGHTSANPEYTADGYDYAVILPGGGGQVKVYDATFCETGSNGSGGNMGAGDHWIGGSPNGVTTLYTLWNENGTPYDTSNDTLVATSGTTFANEIQADYSGVMGTPGHSGLTDCAANAYHNAWYTLATGLAAGRYRMNVNTSSANNASTNAENMWSAWVGSSGTNPQVYGEAKMAAYNNLPAGTQLFYLAQIDASNAGKTMEISLFDPGDVSGNAYLKIKSPNGNAYSYATFSWTADNGTSSPGTQQIQTASAGGSLFNDRLITIDVALPNTYGQSGLTPAGETQPGWWKIEYQVSGGNDTTTWQVAIKGSPVHLVR